MLFGLAALQNATTGGELVEAVRGIELDEATRMIVAVEIESKLVAPLSTDDVSQFLVASGELVTFLEGAGDSLPEVSRTEFTDTLAERADLLLVERVKNADTADELISASAQLAEFMSIAENQLHPRDVSTFGFTVFVEARAKLVAPVKAANTRDELGDAATHLVRFMLQMDDSFAPEVTNTFRDVLLEAADSEVLGRRRDLKRYLTTIGPVVTKSERRQILRRR